MPTTPEKRPIGFLVPIAPRYYPANRSHLLRCVRCGRNYLRYTEAGGYFSEDRIRALQPHLLIDAAL